MFKSIFWGRIENRTLKSFLPPDPLVTLQLPPPRITHIPTITSRQVLARVSTFCYCFRSYFMEATSLWLVHFSQFLQGYFGRKERAAFIILPFWHSADQRNVFTLAFFSELSGKRLLCIFQSTSCSFYCTLCSKYV